MTAATTDDVNTPAPVKTKEVFFVPGCLGTCWYGKYHYLEPFTGCEHDCVYCYAKGRGDVLSLLLKFGTAFETPEIGRCEEAALKQIQEEIDADPDIHTIKLSRYTDIFTRKYTAGGVNAYSYKVLKLLVDSPQIKRVIITTKGVPSPEITELIKQNQQKFSYNAAVKPEADISMETNAPSVDARLKAAADMAQSGILTSIHMDPLLIGIDDTEEVLKPFLAQLKSYGLKRVMFSYLFIDYGIGKSIIDRFGEEFFFKFRENYVANERQMLPKQKDTTYYTLKPEVKLDSIKRIAALLKEGGFNFVVCGLKSSDKDDIISIKNCCPVCDGKFYA